jgi:integrase
MGALYKRKNIWWVKYYVNGRPIRESTGMVKETEARRFLKAREGRVAAGQPMLPRVDRIRYEEIAADLRRHYETTGERKLDEADDRLRPLAQFFNGRRVVAVDGVLAEQYVQTRQAAGVANSTINRELAMLTKMLSFAYEHGKVLRLPVVHKLKEPAPRQGFFEREEFQAVRRRLREDLQVAVTIAFTYGWRMQSEVLKLGLRHVDLEAGTLRLDPGMTKNDDGRVVYLTPELKALLTAQVERVRGLERQRGSIIPHLFPHLRGRHQGKPVGEFYKSWRTACKEAHIVGRIPHDFRRTAVRNLVNVGVPERVAMTVTGHKTRSVFDRYHIVSPGDLQEATQKLAGTISGTLAHTALTPRR